MIPMQIQNVLNSVKRTFLGEENQRSLFIYNQNAPGSPKLNQLANKAVCSSIVRMEWSLSFRPCETHHQAQQVTKHGNGRSNNPSNNPQCHTDPNPGTYSNKVTFMHAIGAGEDTRIYRFARDMAVDDAGNEDLRLLTGKFQTKQSLTIG